MEPVPQGRGMTLKIKKAIEDVVDTTGDFNMTQLYAASWPLIESEVHLGATPSAILKRLGGTNYKKTRTSAFEKRLSY